MSLGFNSDVPVGNDTLHVQTENYGEPQYMIVTLVYHRGRILHRRNSSYLDLTAAPGFSEESLNGRVEAQHRSVIEEIRNGAITMTPGSSPPSGAEPEGLQLRLRNANSWFAAGQATLDLEVTRRKDNAPVEGANVEAFLTGSKEVTRCESKSGADGLARIQFAVPNSAAGGAELVIRADAGASQATDEIRFVLRPRTAASLKTAKNMRQQEPKG